MLAERTSEEEMEGRFFNICIAKDTVVVVAFQLVLFPPKDVPSVESVHQQEPGENSQLVATFGLPNPQEGSRGDTFLYGKL